MVSIFIAISCEYIIDLIAPEFLELLQIDNQIRSVSTLFGTLFLTSQIFLSPGHCHW